MTVMPHDGSDAKIEMGFAEAAPEDTGDDRTQQLAEDILLLGFLGGLRRIKDECNSLKAEYDVLMGNINQDELAEVMESIDASFIQSQSDIDQAIELIKTFVSEQQESN